MAIKNIFILGGGTLQLLNALEAAAHFLKARGDAVLILGKPLRKFEHLVEPESWGRVVWVDRIADIAVCKQPSRTLALRRHTRRVHDVLDEYKGCERLFLGHYNEFHRHLAVRLKPREVVFIGDGMGDLATSRGRRDALNNGHGTSARDLLRQLLYGWKPKHIPRLTFFSSMPVALADGDKLVTNDYQSLRGRFRISEESRREVVAFAGQPLYFSDYGLQDYWPILQGVFANFEGRKEYWCHPKESPEDVGQYLVSLGVEVRKSSKPLEIEFLENGFPQTLLSFCSTSLLTCKLLFASLGIECKFIEGDPASEMKWQVIRKCFDEMGIGSL